MNYSPTPTSKLDLMNGRPRLTLKSKNLKIRRVRVVNEVDPNEVGANEVEVATKHKK